MAPLDPMPNQSEEVDRTDLRGLLFNAQWALRLTLSTHAGLATGLIGSSLIHSMMPAGLALTARGLIDALVEAINLGSGWMDVVVPWLLIGCGLTLTLAVSNLASHYFTQRLNDELDLRITSDILTHASTLDLSLFEDPTIQDIIERAQQNTSAHFSLFLNHTLTAMTNTIQILALFAVLFTVEPLILPALLPVALPYFFFQWRLAKTGYWKEHARATKRRWTRYFIARLTSEKSVAEVKLFDLAPLFTRQLRSLLSEFRQQNSRLHTRSLLGGSLFAVFSTFVFYLAFARVVVRALGGELTVGDVAIFGVAASGLRYTLEQTVLSLSHALERALYITNLIEFLSLSPRLPAHTDLRPESCRGEIQLQNVTFTYPGSSQPAVCDFSVHIKPGETIGLVGENGAGKTTLVKLIARLYDPDAGCILLDGTDLREFSVEYLHRQISFVFQDFGRYEAMVGDNIAYGDWRRLAHDRKSVERAARVANVHDMVQKMPRGYDTMVGRMFGEYELSRGQWQRIAVARAFAREASLLILDEPTSILDARAENELFIRYRELARGRTTILISHRFSTVSMADRIVVMEEGRIIECGNHRELVEKSGHYASLYSLQKRQMAPPTGNS